MIEYRLSEVQIPHYDRFVLRQAGAHRSPRRCKFLTNREQPAGFVIQKNQILLRYLRFFASQLISDEPPNRG